MCECQWEPLAEIDLFLTQENLNLKREIYCLCSRVFIRNGFENANKLDIVNKENDLFVENISKNTKLSEEISAIVNTKDVDSAISCYCSASHTDNISTDEHDSLRSAPPFSRGLQSSDSGADLSESFLEETWEQYWAQNGEKLIWTSWINKYSNYIKPDFFESDNSDSTNHLHTEVIQKDNIDDKSKSIGKKLSDSDSYQSKLVEGWNPLSPASIEDSHQAQELIDNELLINTRCDSECSIVNTKGTTDSMTNVTKITFSSLESSSSSSSTPSSLSEPLSPIRSSLSSSSESENEQGTTIDVDQYWQHLWQQHFEEQYYVNFIKFKTDREKLKNNEQHIMSYEQMFNNHEADRKKKLTRKDFSVMHSVGHALCNLKVMDEEDENFTVNICEFNGREKVELQFDNCKEVEDENTEKKLLSERENHTQIGELILENLDLLENEGKEMRRLGLPTSFGTTSNMHSRKVKRENSSDDENNSTLLKRSHESDSEEATSNSNTDRLSGAFSLMGYVWSPETSTDVSGDVSFRKKHIRLQNRQLKMTNTSNSSVRKHIYFDEEGNTLTEQEEEKVFKKPSEISSADHVLPIDLQTSSDDEKLSENVKKFRSQSKKLTTACNCNEGVENMKLTDNTEFTEVQSSESLESLLARSRNYANRSVDNLVDDFDKSSDCDTNNSIKRERKRKRRSKKNLTASYPSIVIENPELKKYWFKRFQLFSKFDEGISLDYESWFSVTPEKVAKYIAERCSSNVIIDAFCGAGGNTIQFALTCEAVIAIDIDPEKIKLAKHNANIYGVADRIEFIVGDFTKIYHNLIADVVFLSPPWGGPSYLKTEKYDLELMLEPEPLSELLNKAREITNNISVFVPRNSNTSQLALYAGPNGKVEVEQNFLDKSLVSLTAFYGDLVHCMD